MKSGLAAPLLRSATSSALRPGDLNCGKTRLLQISSSDDICQTLAVRDEWYHQGMRIHTFNEGIQVVLYGKTEK